MATTAISLKHLDYVDGWRAVAAIWVVTEHCWNTVHGGHMTGVSGEILSIFGYARMAVDLFIVLSGFCLMLPVIKGEGILRGGWFEFLKRRAWRILPPYYFAMAFCLLLIWFFIHQKTGTIWDESLAIKRHSLLTHLLLLHDAFKPATDDSINYVFWSIAVEWRIYFFFPILVVAWRYLGPLKTTLLAFAASWLLRVFCNHVIGASLTMNYLGLFAGGMLAAAIAFPTSDSLLQWRKLPWGWITLFLSFLVVALYNVPGLESYIRDYGVGLWAMSALIMTSVDRNAWHHKILSFRPLVFTGTFAYSIYLIHSPLLQILWQYVFAPLQPYPLRMLSALMFLGIPAIIGASYLFFLLFERPFVRKRKTAVVASLPILTQDIKLEKSGSSLV